MTKLFGPVYAEHYDLFYQHKDYDAECDFVEELFRRYAGRPVRSILDAGCGTGGHAWRLARRGYAVTAVDQSAAMLAEAREDAEQQALAGNSPAPAFVQADVRSLELGRRFDAAIMMFAVLSYQATNADLAVTLANLRRHLATGGLVIADFWYGPAVLALRPDEERSRVWNEAGVTLERSARARLDVRRQVVEVRYTVRRLYEGVVEVEASEAHDMRFLFPQELAYFAEQAGLALVDLCPSLAVDCAVDESTWNVTAILRAEGRDLATDGTDFCG